MRSRVAQVAHGIVCLVMLLAILVAAPALLVALVGWPLPTSVPRLESIEEALRSGIADATIVKGLACVAWVAWAQVAAAILLDLVAVVRGGITPHAPILPGVQVATGRLVAGATVLFSLLAPGPRVVGATPVRPPPAVAVAVPATPIAPATVDPGNPAPAQPSDKTWTVERHDSYWSIAERTLGDGMRWREIRDANIGRTMPDGQTVTASRDIIAPGWTLALPADALVPAAVTAEPAPTPVAVPVAVTLVGPGESLWSIAEARATSELGRPPTDAEVTPVWSELVAANQQLADPDVLHVGEPVYVGAPAAAGPLPVAAPPPMAQPAPSVPTPTTDAPPPASEPSVREPAPTEPALPAGPTDERPTPTPVDGEAGLGTESAVVALLGVAGAGLAVGLARAVRRRRRSHGHRAHRPQTRPSRAARDTHRTVLAATEAAAPTVERLRAELDGLAVALARDGQPCRPRIVQIGPDHMDVVLDRSTVPAPAGWRAEGSGTAWVKDELGSIAVDTPRRFATPLLVAMGVPEEAGQLHLDLEAEGVVSVLGDDEEVEGLLRSWVTELATSTMAETLQIHVVGDALPDDLALYDRVQRVESWDDVLPDLQARAQQAKDLLTANAWHSTFAARGAGSEHDALAPLVVIGAPPEDLAGLRQLHEHGLGAVAVVLIGADEIVGTEVRCTDGSLTLPSVGLECRSQTLCAEASAALAALVNEDEELEEVEAPFEADEGLREAAAGDRALRKEGLYEDPPHDVLVRLLGNITVIGGNRPIPGKHTAVVAYIALHGQATPGALIDAVWSGTNNPNRRKRLANIVSECRSALGAQHLPQAANGVYRAGPGLMTDTELFNRRVAYAATQSPADAAVTLQGALDLVESAIFTYQRADQQSFSWIDLDNLQESWGQKVERVAVTLSDLYLELGDPNGGIAAAGAALAVLPANVVATEQLMRAHHAAGDRAAVQRTYLAHTAALEALDFDSPAPSTAQLRDRLVG